MKPPTPIVCESQHLAVRAAQITAVGGPDVLRVTDIPTPSLVPGTLLVRVDAAGVGPWDIKARDGRIASPPVPYVPGAELAGVVLAVGDEVNGFAAGDPVWAYPALSGAMATRVVIPADSAARRPASLSAVEAAGVPIGALTALQALDALAIESDKPSGALDGKSLLVLGAAGNVGAYAVQLAARRGAIVVGQARADDADHLRALGASITVDRLGDWPADVRTVAPGGVDALLDAVGGTSLDTALRLVRDGGRAVSIVEAESPEAERGVSLQWVGVHPNGRQLTDLAEMFDAGELRPPATQTFWLDEIAEAHRAVAAGGRGKVIVKLQLHILAVHGDVHACSRDRGLLRAAAELAPDGIVIDVFDRLDDVRRYSAELDPLAEPERTLEVARALRGAIRGADALLVVLSETNHHSLGWLENAIDWVSRQPGATPLHLLPVGLIGLAGGAADAARAQLLRSFISVGAAVVGLPEVWSARATAPFDTELSPANESARAALRDDLCRFGAWVRHTSRPRSGR